MHIIHNVNFLTLCAISMGYANFPIDLATAKHLLCSQTTLPLRKSNRHFLMAHADEFLQNSLDYKSIARLNLSLGTTEPVDPRLLTHFADLLSNISCLSFHMKHTEGRPAKVSYLLFTFLVFKNTLLPAVGDLACWCLSLCVSE